MSNSHLYSALHVGSLRQKSMSNSYLYSALQC